MRILCALLAFVSAAGSAIAADMVPFAIPMAPNPESAIALPYEPVPTDAAWITVKDGRFVVGEERVKIWGVNLCFGACFPKPEDAKRIAARMAAAGVNSVRFHHMDTSRWPRGILDSKDPMKLHPEALDRLDVFLDQLARHGIRANLNLHVGREASRALGLPRSNTRYDKIVGIFTPRLVEAQKQYARDLLTHVNKVRKVRYADDPAVAFVEITNEDSLFMWSAARDLRALPGYYAKILQGRFCRWLKGRYGSTQGVRAAWARGAEPLGDNMLADPEFKMPKVGDPSLKHWTTEMHDGCRFKVVHPPGDPKAVRMEIEKADGTSWHMSFKQRPLSLKGGRYYTVRFRARADQPRPIGYSVGQDAEPWHNLGLSGSVSLTTEWQAFRAGFVAKEDNELARLTFAFSGSAVPVELADVSLCPGGREGLREDESLEAGRIALFAPSEVEVRAADRMRFLAETEKAYFDEMRRFVREDLGSKALVTGTIVFGPCGLYGQSGMDFIDGHAYWQHPQFPGRPWDPGNWRINQVAMTDQPDRSTLRRLAAQQLEGKPYTVSEYNHPAPLDYQAECVPLLAAFAAAQDWHGIWLFAYSHRTADVDRQAFTSFFDIDANPAKWTFMQAGAAIFRRGAVPPLRRTYNLSLGGWEGKTLDEIIGLHARHDRDLFAAADERMKMSWQHLLAARLAVSIEGHSGAVNADVDVEPELAWEVNETKRGTFAASGPGARVLVTHAGGTDHGKGAGIEVAAPAFAAVTLVSLAGGPLENAKAILVTACGRCENTGMQFSADRRTVGRNWGGPPVLIEPVEGRVTLPAGRWQCQALAPDGTPKAPVPLEKGSDGTQALVLAPKHETAWYLVTPLPKR